ncbi:MAG TPA: hypothetical protein VGG72_21360 [Bryobacteraceae bacterium]|jgi:hypothetical protein
MTNLDLIRQKCIEANPDIVELKEGCIVHVNELSHTVFGKDGGKFMAYLNRPFPDDLLVNDFYDCEFSEGTDEIRIIGRPIRLADVLLAAIGKGLAVNTIGVFMSDEEGIMPHTFRAAWNLRKDDLNEQSEETINFLAELLQ